ncbi:phosphotransferase family protein [Brachybacterium sp. GCM10030268]|uniref:phosphotransferase family protein n=1 Tax=Brachybacterium sp. GCM10030268 TaxID=3273382 RepID=UPI0036071AAC
MNPAEAPWREAVAAMIGTSSVDLEDVRREPLDYDAFLAHRDVHRLRGAAVTGTGRRPWSLIEKVTEGPATASPYLLDNGRREHAAYTSGLLEDLAPSLVAPRLYGSQVKADGRITLWLEEIRDEAPRPLEGGSLLAISRDLGAMAGRWLDRVPSHPWLFTGWIDRHAQPEAMEAGLATLERARTPSSLSWTGRVGEAQELIRAQPRVRTILEALPQTLCHHDAVGANTLRSGGRSVLIDWESVGPGPVGADLASLLFASVRRGDASAHVVRSLVEDAFDAYVEGLRSEDAEADVAAARRGCEAAICLRWKLAADVAETALEGRPARRGSAPEESPEQALEELTQLVGILLDAARRVL